MNILVTGGAGYIGSHAVKALLNRGDSVVVLDNLFRGHLKAVPTSAVFYKCELADQNEIEKILTRHRIEAVLHFAALTYVGESVKNPLWYYRNNTAGALSLLSAMQNVGVHRLIFSSTAATYGNAEKMPIEESFDQKPINPYGWSKRFVEQILLDLSVAEPKFGFTALRYFNVAGASVDGSIGEDHYPETHLLPNVLYAALGIKDKISVFGTDYPTPDGTCVRDYVHVEDLISAHLLALDALHDGTKEFYNLGIGRGYSVREILDSSRRVCGKEIPTVDGPRRDGDPASLYASSEKIQEKLGWKPVHTEIDDVVQTAWNWHKNHPDGYGDTSDVPR